MQVTNSAMRTTLLDELVEVLKLRETGMVAHLVK
jgi:hypothetical protein